MIEEFRTQYEALTARLNELGGFFDIAAKREHLTRLEAVIAQPDFWADPARAQQVLRTRRRLESEIETIERFERQLGDVEVLLELAEEDEAFLRELQESLARLTREVEELELKTLLSGPHDAGNAIVTITAGAGGTDAQDWAEMLLRLYLRWAEKHGYRTELLDLQPGQEAGIKSATFRVEGDYAYGYLSAESGVHRLVRLSPFNIGHSRETSFASVFVYPEIEDDVVVEIDEKDLRIETFRSSGAGGQHVNKTESAVRITHLPTGIVVSCQNQRSQHQNREMAMKILRARLYELERQKRQQERQQLEQNKREISFGSQIRSYVLHPYKLVKDLRTRYETSDVERVLDGEIDDFIRQYLLLQRASQAEAVPELAPTNSG
ncbi:MAG TPA: peptide chain release factor 2 [Blastocatellia bacterium]|nr:peptide chain release factor 2 [Blastocatellia bacterium]